jgi:serine/threonine-protein kinase
MPIDLQTIVLRCVEKDPARRYQSARSLAEDLRRYMQNEPIVARQLTRSYRLMRKARKNKATTVSLIITVLVILISAFLYFQSRANAERQAKLVAEFGNEARFIESQLRSAYAAPLHDVSGQVAEVRMRLKKNEDRISVEGKPAYGPGYEALGQSYIAIGDYKKAKGFLEKAWQAGYQEPSTAYALGIVMGKSYQDELLKIERLPSASLRKLKRKQAEENYAKKAVDYLKKGSKYTESPLYVEALIDFYEKRFESALKKSREAFRVISWPYEAKKLEGDIHVAMGKVAQQSGEYKKSLEAFGSADKAYSEAEELARSNEEIYLAKGGGFNAATDVQYETGIRGENYFSKALESCSKAMVTNPGSGKANLCLAEAYYHEAKHLKSWTDQDPTDLFLKTISLAERAELTSSSVDALYFSGLAYLELGERANVLRKDPREYLQNAIKKSEKAEQLDPQSDAFHTLAAAYFLLGEHDLVHGQDPQPALKKVVEIYHEGRKDVSRLAYMQNVLGLAYLSMGDYKLKRGEDPYTEYNKSLSHLKRGVQIDPQAHYIASNIGLCYSSLAQFELSRGKDPKQYCVEALRYYDLSVGQGPREPYAENNKGLSYLFLGEYELLNNRDPNSELSKAVDQFQSAIKLNPNLNYSYVNMASALALRADHKMRQNQNPADELKEAEQNLEKALDPSEEFYEAYRTLGEIQILKARYAISKGRSPINELLSARKSIQEALRINPLDAVSYAGMAQTYRWDALSNDNAAVEAAEKGLEWVQKSKEKKITDPKLTALEGFFHLVLARKIPQNRTQHANAASESLEVALKLNPLLKTDYGSYINEALVLRAGGS